MKLGLVLEGGAMRGVFTAGVLDAFLEQELSFDLCIGVSAGACLGCSYLAKQKGRGFAVMTDYLDQKEYCSISNLLRTGDLFGADFLYHKIPEELYPIDNDAFLNQKTEFYAVVTNCISGKAEHIQIKDMFEDVEYIRASSSLPLMARMVVFDDVPYLDGGISDPIPVKRALEMGCDKVIVILTRHRQFRKNKEKFLPLIKAKYRKFPYLIADIENRHNLYNETLDEIDRLEKEGKILVIAPQEPLDIRRTEKNRNKLKSGYDQGYRLATEKLSEIYSYLQTK